MNMKNEELKPQDISEEFVYEEIDANTEDELKYEDPLDWLHEHRRRVSERYPTVEALFKYYRHFESVSETVAEACKRTAEREQRKKELMLQDSNAAPTENTIPNDNVGQTQSLR